MRTVPRIAVFSDKCLLMSVVVYLLTHEVVPRMMRVFVFHMIRVTLLHVIRVTVFAVVKMAMAFRVMIVSMLFSNAQIWYNWLIVPRHFYAMICLV
jgi:hypothetical protein